MKSKKLINRALFALAILIGVFYACKKESSDVSEAPGTPEDQQSQSQNPNMLARGTGTETIYSVDTNGVYYKMILVWNTNGGVTVDRSIVASGYPAGTEEIFAIDDNITRTEIDLDHDNSSFDILKCTLDPEKSYYEIKFDLSQSDPAPLLTPFPMGYNLFCVCTKKGSSSSCSLRKGSGWSYYCQGCTRCSINARVDLESGFEEAARALPAGGIYLVEATSVTIIN